MNKRGVDLALNTLVIIILVVIVLIVVAVFFLGGTSSLSRSIRNIFYGTTVGTDLALALEQCDNHCSILQGMPPTTRKASGYCRATYDIDQDGNGKIEEGDARGVHCYDNPINVNCVLEAGQPTGASICA